MHNREEEDQKKNLSWPNLEAGGELSHAETTAAAAAVGGRFLVIKIFACQSRQD